MFAWIYVEIFENFVLYFTSYLLIMCIMDGALIRTAEGDLKVTDSCQMSFLCVLVTIRFLQESHEGCPAVL